jgi:hypothetical protein
MRRSLANLLLVLLIATSVLPLVQAKQAVPACCRRAGQHHCATPLPSNGFHSSESNCPYRHITALISHVVTSIPTSSHTLLPDLRWSESLYIESAQLLHCYGNGTSERGPPLV